MNYILDDNKNPVECDDILTWGEWMQCPENKRVALSDLGDIIVSTVFLGIDHSFTFEGPPVLFETMVFNKIKDLSRERGFKLGDEIESERYETFDESLLGHRRMVESFMKNDIN